MNRSKNGPRFACKSSRGSINRATQRRVATDKEKTEAEVKGKLKVAATPSRSESGARSEGFAVRRPSASSVSHSSPRRLERRQWGFLFCAHSFVTDMCRKRRIFCTPFTLFNPLIPELFVSIVRELNVFFEFCATFCLFV